MQANGNIACDRGAGNQLAMEVDNADGRDDEDPNTEGRDGWIWNARSMAIDNGGEVNEWMVEGV